MRRFLIAQLRIWLVSTSRCLSFLERPHFMASGVLSQHPLIRLQFHGDNQILKFYAAAQRLVIEFLDFTIILAVLYTSCFNLFVAYILLQNTEVLNSCSL